MHHTLTAVLLTLLGIGGLLLFVAMIVYVPKAAISGTIAINGLTLTDTSASVHILARAHDSSDAFTETGVVVASREGTSWIWKNAHSGVVYEIKGALFLKGEKLSASEPLIVTAPATDQKITIVLSQTETAGNATVNAHAMQGTVTVNGYIPSDGRINILAAKIDPQNPQALAYRVVTTVSQITGLNSFSWADADASALYKIRAVLMSAGSDIGESLFAEVSGSQQRVSLTVESTAKAPQSTISEAPGASNSAISGSVIINGPQSRASAVRLMKRSAGVGEYAEALRIADPAHNGLTWEIGQLETGARFDLFAQLWSGGTLIADARAQTVTAPGGNLLFTLNSGVIIPNPKNTPTFHECKNETAIHEWDATLSIPRDPDEVVGKYWVWVGDQGGGHNIRAEKYDPFTSSDLTFTVHVQGNKYYYAQYAYALCANCTDDVNFSKFSKGTQFYCGNTPS